MEGKGEWAGDPLVASMPTYIAPQGGGRTVTPTDATHGEPLSDTRYVLAPRE